jgi:hypothetical protein
MVNLSYFQTITAFCPVDAEPEQRGGIIRATGAFFMHSQKPFDDLLDEITEVHAEYAPSVDPANPEQRVANLEQVAGRLTRIERIVERLLLALVEQKNEQ